MSGLVRPTVLRRRAAPPGDDGRNHCKDLSWAERSEQSRWKPERRRTGSALRLFTTDLYFGIRAMRL